MAVSYNFSDTFLGEQYKPIHYAARFGGKKICQFIWERITDIHEVDSNGWTLLHLAANFGRLSMYNSIMMKFETRNPFKKFGKRETPLHLAAERVNSFMMS